MTDPDIIVVGAGFAGLACARALQEAGCNTLVLDKARGIGGRATTRRQQGTCCDRGLPYLPVSGERTAALAAALQATGELQPWPPRARQATAAGWRELALTPGYAAAAGASAIAKSLARDLTLRCNYRLQTLQVQGDRWQLQPASSAEPSLTARAVVLAIPAPQARALLAPLDPQRFPPLARTLGRLAAVQFDPCIAVAAGYPATSFPDLPGEWLAWPGDRQLAHLSLESSKRPAAEATIVAYSTPEFARDYLDTSDLTAASDRLLASVADRLQLPTPPSWTLPHRWRYARATRPAHQPYLLASDAPPLLCCGDWCLGTDVEAALLSGTAAATQLLAQQARQD